MGANANIICTTLLTGKHDLSILSLQCYRVQSDFHPMANDDYVTWLGEFSVILLNLHKVTSLGEIAKNCSYIPYINLNILN